MRRRLIWIVAATLVAAAHADEAAVRATLQKSFPQSPIRAISPQCASPMANIADFAKRHRINSTPTTILADGRRLVGAVPRAQLERELQRAAKP